MKISKHTAIAHGRDFLRGGDHGSGFIGSAGADTFSRGFDIGAALVARGGITVGFAPAAQVRGGQAISGTGSAYDIATLENSGAWSVSFSPDQSRIYVARTDGKLDVFDAASHAKLATWDVGTSLGALSVATNGEFLLVVERFRAPGPFSPPGPTPTSTFYKVDTLTGAVTTFSRSGGAYIDVEIVDGQKAILSGGQQNVTVFNLADHSYLDLPGAVYYSNSSILVEDEHYTLFAETGISSGPLMIYDDRTGTIVASGNNYQTLNASSGQTGFNFGHQAISEAGGLVAQFIYSSTINLFDLQLKFIRGFQITGPVDGLAFDITGKFLYAHSGTQLNLIDVSNGAIVDSFIVAQASWHNNYGPGDQIVLSEDGKTILLGDYTNGTLQIIDLHLRDELFQGTAGAESFAGGKGDDTYIINDAGDTITELRYDGTDLAIASIDYTIGLYVENLRLTGGALSATGNDLDNRIEGNAGSNLLGGLAGNDQLFGDSGDDVLDGGTGNDAMAGGLGNDIFFVDAAADGVIEAGNEGRDVVYASASYTLGAGQEIEVLSTISSAAGTPMNLTGNGFFNEIYGNAGDNVIDGAAGSDYLQGYAGNDIYFIDHGSDLAIEGAGGGRDVIYTSVNFTLGAASEIEVLSTISSALTTPLELTGNSLSNEIFGNAGSNIIDGGGGSDYLKGYGGNDLYFVNHGSDLVIEGAGEGNRDVIYARTSYTLGAGVQVEVLSVAVQGGATAIDLTGNGLVNELYGNAGANYLDGGGGADYLQGFGGNDSYVVETQGDVVAEGTGEGNRDVVFARASYTLGAGVQVEVLSAISSSATTAIDLTGNELVNEVYGNEGANVLNGGLGADYLQGFGGADTFAFTTALGNGNVDQLGDVLAGTDKLALDDAIFAGIGTPGAFNAAAFVTGSQAADADDRIVYNSATGQLFFDADGNGAGAAVLFATLAPGTNLTASDFVAI